MAGMGIVSLQYLCRSLVGDSYFKGIPNAFVGDF